MTRDGAAGAGTWLSRPVTSSREGLAGCAADGQLQGQNPGRRLPVGALAKGRPQGRGAGGSRDLSCQDPGPGCLIPEPRGLPEPSVSLGEGPRSSGVAFLRPLPRAWRASGPEGQKGCCSWAQGQPALPPLGTFLSVPGRGPMGRKEGNAKFSGGPRTARSLRLALSPRELERWGLGGPGPMSQYGHGAVGEGSRGWGPWPAAPKAVGAGRGHSGRGWGPRRHLLILAARVENCKQPKNFVCLRGAGKESCPGPRQRAWEEAEVHPGSPAVHTGVCASPTPPDSPWFSP